MLNQKGIKPMDEKVSAILALRPTLNVKEL